MWIWKTIKVLWSVLAFGVLLGWMDGEDSNSNLHERLFECNSVYHLYYEPLRAVIPFLVLKYCNEYKRPCKILWAATYSGFSALKGYRKYILWAVFWPAELSKDGLESTLDWCSGAAPRVLGQCAMATVPTLKIGEANVYLLWSCVFVRRLTPQRWKSA